MKSLLLLSLALLMTAGCAAPVAPADVTVVEETVPAPFEVTLAGRSGDTTEFDVACLWGGGDELPRHAGRVQPGTEAIEIRIQVPDTYTGYQVGDQLDHGPIHWWPTLGPGERATFTIPVDTGDLESDGDVRWHFHTQANVPAAEQDCYTGAGMGPLVIEVVASGQW